MAHLVLPGQTFLERWGDAFPQRGVYSLVQPVMAPVYPVKAAEDTLLSVAQGLGVGAFKATPTYRDYLQHFRHECARAGIHAFHGHRHFYAQDRHQELTGWACPARGGPTSKQLTPEQKARFEELLKHPLHRQDQQHRSAPDNRVQTNL